jgi:cytochrome c553
MEGILGPLADEELIPLAEHFSQQTLKIGATPEAFVALGQQIYRGGNAKTGVPACAACHEARGTGNPLAGFPALSGQQPDYVIQQLNNFRMGLRKNDPNAMMQDIAKRMSDEEIKAFTVRRNRLGSNFDNEEFYINVSSG